MENENTKEFYPFPCFDGDNYFYDEDDLKENLLEYFEEEYWYLEEEHGITTPECIPEDFQMEVILSDHEPIFNYNEKDFFEILLDYAAERLPEDDDTSLSVIEESLKKHISFDKVREESPTAYYPSGRKYIFTREYIVDLLKD